MNKYSVEKTVGQGSFGKALLCRRRSDGKRCIVKQISISRMGAKEVRLTELEATLLARLRHPNIVSFIESFRSPGNLMIVMEFADGGDLEAHLKKRQGKLLSEDNVLHMFVQIALALKHVHDRKILHRDLKTQNIFLTSNGTVKLGDFGVSRVLERTMDLAATQVGTPYYMPPEICNNQRYNSKCDVWSLGIILYELMALRLPFDGRNIQDLLRNIARKPCPQVSSVHYSSNLRSLLNAMLNKSYSKRPSVNSLLQLPFVMAKTADYLDETQKRNEFSHTILHGKHILRGAPPPSVDVPTSAGAQKQLQIGNRAPAPVLRPPPPPTGAPVPVGRKVGHGSPQSDAADAAVARLAIMRQRELAANGRQRELAAKKAEAERLQKQRLQAEERVKHRLREQDEARQRAQKMKQKRDEEASRLADQARAQLVARRAAKERERKEKEKDAAKKMVLQKERERNARLAAIEKRHNLDAERKGNIRRLKEKKMREKQDAIRNDDLAAAGNFLQGLRNDKSPATPHKGNEDVNSAVDALEIRARKIDGTPNSGNREKLRISPSPGGVPKSRAKNLGVAQNRIEAEVVSGAQQAARRKANLAKFEKILEQRRKDEADKVARLKKRREEVSERKELALMVKNLPSRPVSKADDAGTGMPPPPPPPRSGSRNIPSKTKVKGNKVVDAAVIADDDSVDSDIADNVLLWENSPVESEGEEHRELIIEDDTEDVKKSQERTPTSPGSKAASPRWLSNLEQQMGQLKNEVQELQMLSPLGRSGSRSPMKDKKLQVVSPSGRQTAVTPPKLKWPGEVQQSPFRGEEQGDLKQMILAGSSFNKSLIRDSAESLHKPTNKGTSGAGGKASSGGKSSSGKKINPKVPSRFVSRPSSAKSQASQQKKAGGTKSGVKSPGPSVRASADKEANAEKRRQQQAELRAYVAQERVKRQAERAMEEILNHDTEAEISGAIGRDIHMGKLDLDVDIRAAKHPPTLEKTSSTGSMNSSGKKKKATGGNAMERKRSGTALFIAAPTRSPRVTPPVLSSSSKKKISVGNKSSANKKSISPRTPLTPSQKREKREQERQAMRRGIQKKKGEIGSVGGKVASELEVEILMPSSAPPTFPLPEPHSTMTSANTTNTGLSDSTRTEEPERERDRQDQSMASVRPGGFDSTMPPPPPYLSEPTLAQQFDEEFEQEDSLDDNGEGDAFDPDVLPSQKDIDIDATFDAQYAQENLNELLLQMHDVVSKLENRLVHNKDELNASLNGNDDRSGTNNKSVFEGVFGNLTPSKADTAYLSKATEILEQVEYAFQSTLGEGSSDLSAIQINQTLGNSTLKEVLENLPLESDDDDDDDGDSNGEVDAEELNPEEVNEEEALRSGMENVGGDDVVALSFDEDGDVFEEDEETWREIDDSDVVNDAPSTSIGSDGMGDIQEDELNAEELAELDDILNGQLLEGFGSIADVFDSDDEEEEGAKIDTSLTDRIGNISKKLEAVDDVMNAFQEKVMVSDSRGDEDNDSFADSADTEEEDGDDIDDYESGEEDQQKYDKPPVLDVLKEPVVYEALGILASSLHPDTVNKGTCEDDVLNQLEEVLGSEGMVYLDDLMSMVQESYQNDV